MKKLVTGFLALLVLPGTLLSSQSEVNPSPARADHRGGAAQETRTPLIQPPIWASKPDVAAFEWAVNDALSAADRAIAQIAAVKGLRTIENTLVPFDEEVRQNDNAFYFANVVQQVHPDAAFRDKAKELINKAHAQQTALLLNPDIYHALASLDLSKADAATRHYLQHELLEFRLTGVCR